MAEKIGRYMSKFENASWKTMVGVAIVVPGVGVATFIAFCGLRVRRAWQKRYARE